MKILMLIPQAFYSTRGTPLSAYHRIRYIIKLGHEIDILTYPIGDKPPELTSKVYRSVGPHFAKHIKQGPSYLKVWFDCIFFLNLIYRLLRKRYDLIYTHEESGFMYALLLSIFRIPFVYDMHSSLPLQIKEWEFSQMKAVFNLFQWIERYTLRRSAAVVAISPGVADAAKKALPSARVFTMLNSFETDYSITIPDDMRVRTELGIHQNKKMILYTGSFVALQSLDLLIKSIPEVIKKVPESVFVLVGGNKEEIVRLQLLSDKLEVSEYLMLLPARPQAEMPDFIAACDVLVSPRIKGINPPGKLLSYLNSGKPVVATDCYVHNQLIDSSFAILAEPSPEKLAEGIIKALVDRAYVYQIVSKAKDVVRTKYSYETTRDGYRKLFKLIETN